MTGFYAGFDVGGTHVSGVCIDRKLSMVKGGRTDFPDKRKKGSVMKDISVLVSELCDGEKISGIGMGVPGPVRDGVMLWSCNSRFMEKTDFKKMLRKWNSNVSVDNDVNCMAFGEMTERKVKNLLAVTLGTGVGGGIVIDGRIHNTRPYAGEVGHMSIDPHGVKCTCGARGCFQEYVSTRGVMVLSMKHLSEKLAPDRLHYMASRGDRAAIHVWEDYGKLLGTGLSNLANILDPEVIVLGGGISGAFEMFEKEMNKTMKKRLHMKPPEVVKGKDDAVAFGAACMAMKA